MEPACSLSEGENSNHRDNQPENLKGVHLILLVERAVGRRNCRPTLPLSDRVAPQARNPLDPRGDDSPAGALLNREGFPTR